MVMGKIKNRSGFTGLSALQPQTFCTDNSKGATLSTSSSTGYEVLLPTVLPAGTHQALTVVLKNLKLEEVGDH